MVFFDYSLGHAKYTKAKYEEEETIVYKKYKARRARGLVVDGEFIKQTMLFELKAAGKNEDGAFKASNKWLSGFTKRWGVSKQKKPIRKVKV